MFIIKIEGLEELKKKLNPAALKIKINAAIKKAMIYLQGEAIKNTPVGVTGILRNSFRVTYSDFRAELYNIEKYGLFVHEGTKPHRTSIRNLTRWADIKGINPYALQRSIAKKGTKGNPFMTKTFDKAKDKVVSILRENLQIN